MNKILYYMSVISQALFLIMVIILLPYILDSSWPGIMFLAVTIFYIGLCLIILLKARKKMQTATSYHILNIALAFYLGIIFTRILLVKLQPSVLYELNMTYCKNNFFLLSITMICVILNTFMLLIMRRKR